MVGGLLNASNVVKIVKMIRDEPKHITFLNFITFEIFSRPTTILILRQYNLDQRFTKAVHIDGYNVPMFSRLYPSLNQIMDT